MKPYEIRITGTGHSGDENPNAIEKRCQQLLNTLTGNGHQITGATLIIEGQEIPLTSGLTGLALPSVVLPKQASAPSCSDAEVPISLRTILDAVNEGRKEAQEFFEKRDDKKRAAVSKGPEKKKGPPPAPDAATPQAEDTGSSAQAEDTEEKPADEKPQESEGGDVQA